MNCQLFRSIVRELTSNNANELKEREEALVHADSCALCSKILEAEKALTLGLRHLAGNTANENVSPSVEAQLIASFRALHSNSKPEPVGPGAVNAFNRARPPKRAYVWSAAIAASVAIFTILFGAYFVLSQRGPVAANLLSTRLSFALELDWQRMTETKTQQEKDKIKQRRVSASKLQTAYVVRREKPRSFDIDEKNKKQAGEMVTNFISLMPSSDSFIPESGQVYRVKLSRSALVSFGLPINMERAGDQIMADVIVSEDGMARAIRFVRDN